MNQDQNQVTARPAGTLALSAPCHKPRRGDRFVHKSWLDSSTGRPLLCMVTAVRGGSLYYRADYGLHDDGTPWLGSSTHFPLADVRKYATAWTDKSGRPL